MTTTTDNHVQEMAGAPVPDGRGSKWLAWMLIAGLVVGAALSGTRWLFPDEWKQIVIPAAAFLAATTRLLVAASSRTSDPAQAKAFADLSEIGEIWLASGAVGFTIVVLAATNLVALVAALPALVLLGVAVRLKSRSHGVAQGG